MYLQFVGNDIDKIHLICTKYQN